MSELQQKMKPTEKRRVKPIPMKSCGIPRKGCEVRDCRRKAEYRCEAEFLGKTRKLFLCEEHWLGAMGLYSLLSPRCCYTKWNIEQVLKPEAIERIMRDKVVIQVINRTTNKVERMATLEEAEEKHWVELRNIRFVTLEFWSFDYGKSI